MLQTCVNCEKYKKELNEVINRQNDFDGLAKRIIQTDLLIKKYTVKENELNLVKQNYESIKIEYDLLDKQLKLVIKENDKIKNEKQNLINENSLLNNSKKQLDEALICKKKEIEELTLLNKKLKSSNLRLEKRLKEIKQNENKTKSKSRISKADLDQLDEMISSGFDFGHELLEDGKTGVTRDESNKDGVYFYLDKSDENENIEKQLNKSLNESLSDESATSRTNSMKDVTSKASNNMQNNKEQLEENKKQQKAFDENFSNLFDLNKYGNPINDLPASTTSKNTKNLPTTDTFLFGDSIDEDDDSTSTDADDVNHVPVKEKANEKNDSMKKPVSNIEKTDSDKFLFDINDNFDMITETSNVNNSEKDKENEILCDYIYDELCTDIVKDELCNFFVDLRYSEHIINDIIDDTINFYVSEIIKENELFKEKFSDLLFSSLVKEICRNIAQDVYSNELFELIVANIIEDELREIIEGQNVIKKLSVNIVDNIIIDEIQFNLKSIINDELAFLKEEKNKVIENKSNKQIESDSESSSSTSSNTSSPSSDSESSSSSDLDSSLTDSDSEDDEKAKASSITTVKKDRVNETKSNEITSNSQKSIEKDRFQLDSDEDSFNESPSKLAITSTQLTNNDSIMPKNDTKKNHHEESDKFELDTFSSIEENVALTEFTLNKDLYPIEISENDNTENLNITKSCDIDTTEKEIVKKVPNTNSLNKIVDVNSKDIEKYDIEEIFNEMRLRPLIQPLKTMNNPKVVKEILVKTPIKKPPQQRANMSVELAIAPKHTRTSHSIVQLATKKDVKQAEKIEDKPKEQSPVTIVQNQIETQQRKLTESVNKMQRQVTSSISSINQSNVTISSGSTIRTFKDQLSLLNKIKSSDLSNKGSVTSTPQNDDLISIIKSKKRLLDESLQKKFKDYEATSSHCKTVTPITQTFQENRRELKRKRSDAELTASTSKIPATRKPEEPQRSKSPPPKRFQAEDLLIDNKSQILKNSPLKLRKEQEEIKVHLANYFRKFNIKTGFTFEELDNCIQSFMRTPLNTDIFIFMIIKHYINNHLIPIDEEKTYVNETTNLNYLAIRITNEEEKYVYLINKLKEFNKDYTIIYHSLINNFKYMILSDKFNDYYNLRISRIICFLLRSNKDLLLLNTTIFDILYTNVRNFHFLLLLFVRIWPDCLKYNQNTDVNPILLVIIYLTRLKIIKEESEQKPLANATQTVSTMGARAKIKWKIQINVFERMCDWKFNFSSASDIYSYLLPTIKTNDLFIISDSEFKLTDYGYQYMNAFKLLCKHEGCQWTLNVFIKQFIKELLSKWTMIKSKTTNDNEDLVVDDYLIGFFLLLESYLISHICTVNEYIEVIDAIKSFQLFISNNNAISMRFNYLIECCIIESLLVLTPFEPSLTFTTIQIWYKLNESKMPLQLKTKIKDVYNLYKDKLPKYIVIPA